MSQAAAESIPEVRRHQRIEPRGLRLGIELREIWAYRDLLYFLAWRDIKVRYKQTILGGTWAIIQPLTTMIIFSIFFGRLAGIRGEYGVPYPLFVYAGLLPWLYFASSLTQSSVSIVGSSALVTKVYFPRLIIPLASVCVPVVDFVISFVVLIGMFLYYGRAPHWHAVAMPVFLGMALLTAFGVGLWLSALNVRYRDIPYVIPFLTQIWMFLSPVIYGVTLVPSRWRWLLALNPMTGIIDGFRWAVLGSGLPEYRVYAISGAVGVCLTLSGLLYFRSVERHFADVI
jgi:lipopolysaccharide transport system permease protein